MSEENLNSSGEFVRSENTQGREVEPAERLTELFEEIQGGNNLPLGIPSEPGKIYYKQDKDHFRADHVRLKLEEFKKIAEESGVRQFLDHSGNYIDVVDAVAHIETNLVYSDQVNAEITKNPEKYKFITTEEQRRKMRERLSGKVQND